MNTIVTSTARKQWRWHQMVGPGLLYAGAAVGVSHLVQSTRAGAEYGWWPVLAIAAIHVAKYPFFRMGPSYALRTGRSLIDGYFGLGWWAVGLFLLFTVGSMWAIIAAVTSVTAGIASFLFGLSANNATVSGTILALCAALLIAGRYSWLDRSISYIVIVLTCCTILAFAAALPDGQTLHPETLVPVMGSASLVMMVNLMGWMPAPLDLSVWHSIWALEKRKESPGQYDYRRAMSDFNVGYWGTAVLGAIFLGMGVCTLYGTGTVLPPSGVGFSRVLMGMYTSQLGQWAFYIVGVAALATMVSTTLTCFDAIPRSLTEVWNTATGRTTLYRYALVMAFTALGAMALLTFWNPGMVRMVDLATAISFCSTPAYAWLNLKTVMQEQRQRGQPIGKGWLMWCRISIAFLSALAVAFLFLV